MQKAELETAPSKSCVSNELMRRYMSRYDSIAEGFERSVERFGLPFEPQESDPRHLRGELCERCGIDAENSGFSLRRGWISPSCVACRKGLGSATFFISLACHRNCYFCFNPNQEDYEYHLSHKRDIVREIREARNSGALFDHIAVTGGEPLLFFEELENFVSVARELYPEARIRLYTCGDHLDAARTARLAAAGLNEIRFSIKLEDESADLRAEDSLFDRFAEARALGIDVMVEMPVAPHEVSAMKDLMRRLDSAGVRGINLLELCFPFWNAEEFAKRGLRLRKVPYHTLYDYWYGGGLPVAGSEGACLELLEFAAAENLQMGVHYCSTDNKNTGQLFQQNYPHRRRFGFCSFSGEGFYLVSVKVFGPAASALKAHFGEDKAEQIRLAEDGSYVEFKPELVALLPEELLSHQALYCRHVVELSEQGCRLREVGVDPIRLEELASSIRLQYEA